MCRSIVTLRSRDESQEAIRAAAVQYVRKISGYRKPSKTNAEAFEAAVEEIAVASAKLLASLQRAERNVAA